jgi:hypothetical protein
MKLLRSIRIGLLLLSCLAAWSELMHAQQEGQPGAPAAATSSPLMTGLNNTAVNNNDNESLNPNPGEDRMMTPPPVSGQIYPLAPASEERSNYIRGGVTFTSAYSDNVVGSTGSTPVSDVSYSVWPTIALDETTSRLHTTLTYAPGFTFYQRVSAFNQADQNAAIDLQYRLSPHVTLSAHDGFQKTSNVFNQPDQGFDLAVSGAADAANTTIVAPLADQLVNTGNVGITYQFSANGMVGGSGTFTNLHYPNPDQVPGLYDDAACGGSAFFATRITPQHYIGVTYQYQQLLSYPGAATNETQTHAILGFYTFYPARTFSFSLFGGPLYYNSGAQFFTAGQSAAPAVQSWTPAAGAGLNWQLARSSYALSYLHTVTSGSGLVGAVELDSLNASVRAQITRNIIALLAGTYGNNNELAFATLGGHTILASAGLQRAVGQHINLQAGYTRLHQTYSFFSANPDSNRESVSISYQFARPIGR